MPTKRYGPYSIEIFNAGKVFFPDCGITKGEIVDYYDRVAETMLPHVRGRIVTMRRFPNGITGKSFYQKEVPDYFPEWIERVEVKKEDGKLVQLVIENAATLVYLANQACITPHVWLSRAVSRDRPDRLIFDLDPSDSDFGPVRDGARELREMLQQAGLHPYLMTTGSRGLHVVVPLDESASFDEARKFAQRVAEDLAARDPKHFTVEQRKAKRKGRIFLDTLRNAYAQHGVAPYAVRAKPGAPVATPVDWKELGSIEPQKYTVKNIFQRLSQKTDPWKGIGRHASSIAAAARQR
ncbi:MAG TPA: non-homologous end-joining DNA ligase [Candidatus Binatia bacterium]|nr:non-homologous end-joining DNA ligase [Candidatus Binatia bacterium]